MVHKVESAMRFLFLVLITLVCGKGEGVGDAKISKDVAEDANLNASGLLTKYGYPYEVHEVKTNDGYLLTTYRITGAKGQAMQKNKPAVFLMHGLSSSSDDWIIMGPQNGLAYILADQGFDVWIGNARGNKYSRKHATLNPDKDSAFWNFSWNEIGYYDLPAMIDFALAKTGKKQLHYLGHSQGSATFFVMCALRKEYNTKIKLMVALAPAAYMSHAKNLLFKYSAPFGKPVELLISLTGINELFPNSALRTEAAVLLCNDNSSSQTVCSSILSIMYGANPKLLNTTALPIILGHIPAGASSRQFTHYGQGIVSAKFRKYDFGPVINMVKYNQTTPPDYDLKKVTAPVAVYYSDNDYLSHPIDVKQLYNELANPIGIFKMPMFTHIDYLWAINIKSLLYDDIIKMMKNYE